MHRDKTDIYIGSYDPFIPNDLEVYLPAYFNISTRIGRFDLYPGITDLIVFKNHVTFTRPMIPGDLHGYKKHNINGINAGVIFYKNDQQMTIMKWLHPKNGFRVHEHVEYSGILHNFWYNLYRCDYGNKSYELAPNDLVDNNIEQLLQKIYGPSFDKSLIYYGIKQVSTQIIVKRLYDLSIICADD